MPHFWLDRLRVKLSGRRWERGLRVERRVEHGMRYGPSIPSTQRSGLTRTSQAMEMCVDGYREAISISAARAEVLQQASEAAALAASSSSLMSEKRPRLARVGRVLGRLRRGRKKNVPVEDSADESAYGKGKRSMIVVEEEGGEGKKLNRERLRSLSKSFVFHSMMIF